MIETTEAIAGESTRASYHADPAVSRSDLVLFHESRLEYHAYKCGLMDYPSELDPASAKDAMNKGTATHTLILEPEKADSIVIWDGGTRSGKVWDKFRRQNRDKVILTELQYLEAVVMAEAVKKVVGGLLANPSCEFEKDIRWKERSEDKIVDMRALLDVFMLTSGGAMVVDFKTTPDASLRSFRKCVIKWLLWLQDAHYSEAVEQKYGIPAEDVDFLFVCLGKSNAGKFAKACLGMFGELGTLPEIEAAVRDKVAPVAGMICKVHRISGPQRLRAQLKRRETLRNLLHCQDTGDWSEVNGDQIGEMESVVPE